ncbi:hypothetical protein SPRG_19415 [Saprolegnia parasitica CBS 223.65]|uniref:SWIM-type domain-containing protein n=1 Tax=Saprolegnia parasitica (strain CBS 223.65) TaxID=695850 RepID=A0A067D1S8_SAPPC|nr:hypothetical protein SPRG_19415 [Saprolegnia parasitica CBS 223.65]KDO32671.1 hypothetical protein SPRG_19415 [Saprolegnia parasitica CBS 223.65]|eukprot:XP_012196654.1 hypothetical protein SPRG_19415 [Saprolegnia parasitica CBS 223.65]
MAFDLQALHGYDRPMLKAEFPSATHFKYFVQDYCFNSDTSCKMGFRSGSKSQYICTSTPCEWHVTATRIRRKGSTGKSFEIASMNLVHCDSCTSTSKATERQAAMLPAVKALVLAQHDSSKESLVNGMQDKVLEQYTSQLENSYNYIPWLLTEFGRANPTCRVSLEADTKSRFYRAFVSFGVFVAAGPRSMPVMGLEAAHFKTKHYKGSSLTLVQKDGNGQNVVVAFAILPKESVDNYFWFFANCTTAGITVNPLFVDQKKAVVAGRALSATNIPVVLKFCCLHIIQSVKAHFDFSGPSFEEQIWNLQASTSRTMYMHKLDMLTAKYGYPLRRYLEDIPPVKWVVFANMANFADMEGRRLYKSATTTFTEHLTDDNGAMRHKVQRSLPFGALFKSMERAAKAVAERDAKARQWLQEKRVLTPFAKDFYLTQKSMANMYLTKPTTDGVYCVYRSTAPMHDQEMVNLNDLTCTCVDRDQMELPCRHLIAGLKAVNKMERILQAYGYCYTMEAYAQAYKDKRIDVPRVEAKVADPNLKSPPLVRAPKRKRKRDPPRNRRNPSSKTYKCRKCHGEGHNISTCPLVEETEVDVGHIMPSGEAYAGFTAPPGYSIAMFMDSVLDTNDASDCDSCKSDDMEDTDELGFCLDDLLNSSSNNNNSASMNMPAATGIMPGAMAFRAI